MEAVRRLVNISRLAKRQKANRHKPVKNPAPSEFCVFNVTVEHLKWFDYYVFKSDFCLVSAEELMQC